MTIQEGDASIGVSEPTLKIVTVGRRTGLPHIAVVRFVRHDGVFYLFAGRSKSDWVLNARARGHAKLRLGEFAYEAAVVPSGEDERTMALELFKRKYGGRLTGEWYSRSEACIVLRPTGPAVRRGAIRGENEVKSSFSEWRSRNEGYYSGVARAFDSASEEYDFTISNNFINRWIRERSIKQLLSMAKREDTLLEIGCGTGAEAIEISKRVRGIVATDISPMMIALLERKVEARRLGGRIRPVLVGASEISRVSGYLPGGRTRLAYSFNGALNCEPNMDGFPDELSKVLEHDGYFVCSIRNSLCLSEAVAHGAVLQFEKMAPRKRQPIMVSVGGTEIPSYYYSPGKFASFFRPRFKVKKMFGLPAILPPAYLSDLYFRARGVLSFVERVEVATAGSFPFNRLGDQTLFVFQKE